MYVISTLIRLCVCMHTLFVMHLELKNILMYTNIIISYNYTYRGNIMHTSLNIGFRVAANINFNTRMSATHAIQFQSMSCIVDDYSILIFS